MYGGAHVCGFFVEGWCAIYLYAYVNEHELLIALERRARDLNHKKRG